ncbi:MAG: hypothetical protein WDO73_04595 [Ignavibacteriota bacterium]
MKMCKRLRAVFAGYSAAEIVRYLASPPPEAPAPGVGEVAVKPLDALIRLFHECFYANEAELPADTLELLQRLNSDRLRHQAARPDLCHRRNSAGRRGVLIVCDRGGAPDGSEYPLPPDVVYPPIFDNTTWYLASLRGLPAMRCWNSAPAPGLRPSGERATRATSGLPTSPRAPSTSPL